MGLGFVLLPWSDKNLNSIKVINLHLFENIKLFSIQRISITCKKKKKKAQIKLQVLCLTIYVFVYWINCWVNLRWEPCIWKTLTNVTSWMRFWYQVKSNPLIAKFQIHLDHIEIRLAEWSDTQPKINFKQLKGKTLFF